MFLCRCSQFSWSFSCKSYLISGSWYEEDNNNNYHYQQDYRNGGGGRPDIATARTNQQSQYHDDLIYTRIGPMSILVALNPFKWIAGVYDEEVKDKYKSKQFNLSENPHVFATAHDAYSDLELLGLNQSLIIR